MFGARNGTGHPASNAQRPSHNSNSNKNNTNGDSTPSLRRRLSSDSISSVGSAGSAPVTNRALTPSLHHPQQIQQQQQQQLHQLAKSLGPSGAIANKELNIQVVVRIRNRSEREVKENSPVVVQAQNKEITVPSTLGDRAPSKSYSFDRVFMYSDQQSIYNEVVTPILEEVLLGYNCTIFAYGQTGTGKTYTMEGDLRDKFGDSSREAGIIPRTLYRLFDALKAQNEFTVRVSFLELYNEEIKDLLAPDDDRKAVKIFDSVKKQGPLVQGLEEVPVFDAQQGIEALRRGSAKRTVAATKSNDKSSRSHGVFSITVHVKETSDDGEELLKIGKLNLVDLAGSENIARSGAEATQAKEAGRINQSLLTLGRVINSLVERSQHIPYRESKLTRLLEDSLGGKTKTCIIATISPARSSLEETFSTLNYANRAKNIKNTPEINQKMTKKALIKEYLVEIDRLKADLSATREKNGVFMTQESYQALLDEATSNKDLVGETQKQAEKVAQELQLLEEKFRENMKLLTTAEYKLGVSNAELETKRAELEKSLEELTKTKQILEEETILRQAHAHTETKLNSIAAGMRSTLSTSVKDIKGLHEKLERKTMIERENREALAEFQEKLLALSGELGDRIEQFGVNQGGLLTSVTQRMDEAFKEATEGAESATAFVTAQLERMDKAMASFQALDVSGTEDGLAFKKEFEALRAETCEFLNASTESTILSATEGFGSLKKALAAYTGYVEKQHEGLTSGMLGLVDESAAFSRDGVRQIQGALDAYAKSTAKEIEFLARQNQALRQQLQEQEVLMEGQKAALLKDIGGLVDVFMKDQTSALMCHITNSRDALEESTGRLSAAHTQQQSWTREFGVQGAKRIDQFAESRRALEADGVETKARVTREGGLLVAKASILSVGLQERLEAQQAAMESKIGDWNAKALQGHEQAHSQQAAMAKLYDQTSDHTITALKDLSLRTTTSAAGIEAVYRKTSEDVTAASDQMRLFNDDVQHNLGVTREETESLVPHRLKVDDSTGRTPSRRKYKYPHTWGVTRPSQDLLREFRELGRVKVFTTELAMERDLSRESSDAEEGSRPSSPLDEKSTGVFSSLPELCIDSRPMMEVERANEEAAPLDQESTSVEMLSPVSNEARSLSSSAPTSRRESQAFVLEEVEKEKENSVETRPPVPSMSLHNGSHIARPVRPGFVKKTVPGSGAQTGSVLSKRSAAAMEAGDRDAASLADISSNVHGTQNDNPFQERHQSGTGAGASALTVKASLGRTAFGTGKSGLVNSAEGPRKVIRPTLVKPVRRPFGSNNRS
ncbi:kinesin motor protein cin8 [Linnemannia hyalina]|uniref:Kinesin motor protein cin8 n=1 Tax=Linnemannia hyalina TaxID=64524 RepID=A0A9P8BZM7_9FUNG|nr:kinesin motor protein cin8 [Linnemannia hyalina]